MIARFVGKTDAIDGKWIVQGKEYNVERVHLMTEWLYFRISELDSYKGTLMPYHSWQTFYANWQPMVPMTCENNVCCLRFTCPCCKMR